MPRLQLPVSSFCASSHEACESLYRPLSTVPFADFSGELAWMTPLKLHPSSPSHLCAAGAPPPK